VPVKSIFSLLVQEILNPFYIFQVFAVVLWMLDGYRAYAFCIIVVSSGSVIASLWENISNNRKIRKMARYSCPIEVKMPDSTGNSATALQEIDSSGLVPGDIVKVPQGRALPCDLILLTGSAIVNEAMLTGESVPVMKSSLPVVNNEVYSLLNAGKHTLFGGTNVI